MRIKTDTNRQKIIVISTVVVVLVISLVTGWYFLHSRQANNSAESDSSSTVEPASSELSEEDAASKQEFIESQQDQSDSSNSDSSESSSSIALTATQDGTSVTIVSQISGIGDGACSLTIKNNNKSIALEADVIYQSSYSTCAGFSVPVSQLGNGLWDIDLSVTSNDGTEAAQSTSLEVS